MFVQFLVTWGGVAVLLWLVSVSITSQPSVYSTASTSHDALVSFLPTRVLNQSEFDRAMRLWNRGSIIGPATDTLVVAGLLYPFNGRNDSDHDRQLRLLAGFLITTSIACCIHIMFWGKYLIGTNPDIRGYCFAARAVNTLILCAIVHMPASLFLIDWYSHLFANSASPLLYLTPLAVETPLLVAIAVLGLLLYPLVFFHLRWKRAAKLATQSPDSPHCPNCNYERGTLDTCPECGTPRSTPSTKLSKAKRRTLIAGYAAIPILLIAPFWISWIDIAIYHLTN